MIEVKLNFRECFNLTNGLSDLGESLSLIPSLKRFSFDAYSWSCSESEFQGLYTFLPRVDIEVLNLDLAWCENFGDQALISLFKELKRRNTLKSLDLCLSLCCKLTDNAFIHMKERLRGLSSLQEINLVMNHCEYISDKGIIALKSALQEVPNLQKVKLSLKDCPKLTNDTLSRLKESTNKNCVTELVYAY
jgi:hypothetical protein